MDEQPFNFDPRHGYRLNGGPWVNLSFMLNLVLNRRLGWTGWEILPGDPIVLLNHWRRPVLFAQFRRKTIDTRKGRWRLLRLRWEKWDRELSRSIAAAAALLSTAIGCAEWER